MLTVFANVAEFQSALIRHQTDKGRQAAKRRGVLFRRGQKLRPDQKTLALSLVQEGRCISEVARTFNVAHIAAAGISEDDVKSAEMPVSLSTAANTASNASSP